MNSKEYNIAIDCIDSKALNPEYKHKTALAFINGDPLSTTEQKAYKITYENLYYLTNRAADVFSDLGLKPGARVMIRLSNVPEFPIAFFGAIKAGFIPVPISTTLKPSECLNIVQDSGAEILISDMDDCLNEFLSGMSRVKNVFVVCEKDKALPQNTTRFQEILLQASPSFSTVLTKAEDPAYLLYTSGTTGALKAVLHSHQSIPAHDARVKKWLGLKDGDIVFNTSALNWSYSLTGGMLDILRHGQRALFFQGELLPENIVHLINHYNVNVFMSVPGLYRRILAYMHTHRIRFHGLRACVSASELLPDELRREFYEMTEVTIREGFGMTEHSVYVAQDFEHPAIPGSCGQPLESQWVKILKDDLTEAGVDEPGILATHKDCPGLFLGYRDAQGTIHRPLSGDWFLSGDLVKKDDEGNLFYLGRTDDLLNVGGYRISPIGIEESILELPEISEVALTLRRNDKNVEYLCAVVVLKDEKTDTQMLTNKLFGYLRLKHADYKIPRDVVFLKEIPKTSNGKIKRSEV